MTKQIWAALAATVAINAGVSYWVSLRATRENEARIDAIETRADAIRLRADAAYTHAIALERAFVDPAAVTGAKR